MNSEASRADSDLRRARQRDVLKVELSLHRASKSLHANEPAVGWRQIVNTTLPLLKRIDTPGAKDPAVSRLKMWMLTLIGDLSLAMIDQAWREDAPRRARRHWVQGDLLLKNAPDYDEKERHTRLFAAWKQKLKAAVEPVLAWQQLLASLEQSAEQVRNANVSEARSLLALMQGKLKQLRELQAGLPTQLEMNLAAELENELREHVENLEQRERQRQHEADFARLRQAWPRLTKDQATSHAFRLATVCKSSSDRVDRPGWDALETAFDQQNARRLLFRAVEQVRSNSSRSAPVRLTEAAVRLDPTLAPIAAVLMGATAFSWLDRTYPQVREERERLLEQGRTLADYAQETGQLDRQKLRQELLQETEAFLRRLSTLLIRQAGQSNNPRRAARQNARELSRTLQPLVRFGSVDDLRVAGQIVDHWRKVTPDAFDPRHPLHALRRRLQVQQRLLEASGLLVQAASVSGRAATELQAKAKALVGDAIHLGILQWRPLKEAIRLYGIAHFSTQGGEAKEQLGHFMKRVATEYAAVRNGPQEQKKGWLRNVNLLTVDRWAQQASSAANSRP